MPRMDGSRGDLFAEVQVVMPTGLSEREREYCIRTAHLYSPCIGTSLPDIHAGDEIRLD